MDLENIMPGERSSHESLHITWLHFYETSRIGKEKAMAPHSSTLAWKIPQTEEPGGLQSMGSLRIRHD